MRCNALCLVIKSCEFISCAHVECLEAFKNGKSCDQWVISSKKFKVAQNVSKSRLHFESTRIPQIDIQISNCCKLLHDQMILHLLMSIADLLISNKLSPCGLMQAEDKCESVTSSVTVLGAKWRNLWKLRNKRKFQWWRFSIVKENDEKKMKRKVTQCTLNGSKCVAKY